MVKFNAENERTKRCYFEWEKEANGKSISTIDNMRNAIYLFEKFTKFKSFKQITKEDIIAFKKHLTQKLNLRTQEPISKTYLLHTSNYLINLFKWLYGQKGYKQKINIADIAYFNLSDKDIQTARSPISKRYPTLEQLEHVIKNMPAETDVQKRNRAVIALLTLTGARVTAVASLKIKHVNLEAERIDQHPQEVKTKYSKKIITFFFPVGDIFKTIFIEWVHFLKHEKLSGNNASLFPSTKLSLDENSQFSRQKLDAVAWQTTACIRTIVKEAFEAAGLDYYNPHSFRNTIVNLGYQVCKTAEDSKAWSQNLGHSSLLTTFTSYGHIEEYSQGAIIKRLGKSDDDKPITMRDMQKLLAQNNTNITR
ncbi:MAG: tyrosine-type recombinase/integrase [Candidatus Dependentiae bacterium]|nr:tyrosine-type recombinase/integrase [Candidatus Dependentiae bacterium]